MRKCRTLNGLLTAIDKGIPACLEITALATKGSGNHLIGVGNSRIYEINNETYQKIEPYLVRNW